MLVQWSELINKLELDSKLWWVVRLVERLGEREQLHFRIVERLCHGSLKWKNAPGQRFVEIQSETNEKTFWGFSQNFRV